MTAACATTIPRSGPGELNLRLLAALRGLTGLRDSSSRSRTTTDVSARNSSLALFFSPPHLAEIAVNRNSKKMTIQLQLLCAHLHTFRTRTCCSTDLHTGI